MDGAWLLLLEGKLECFCYAENLSVIFVKPCGINNKEILYTLGTKWSGHASPIIVKSWPTLLNLAFWNYVLKIQLESSKCSSSFSSEHRNYNGFNFGFADSRNGTWIRVQQEQLQNNGMEYISVYIRYQLEYSTVSSFSLQDCISTLSKCRRESHNFLI